MSKQMYLTTKTALMKVGGAILDCEFQVQKLCQAIKEIKAAGWQLILVHGGGQAINTMLSAHQISAEFKEGLRVTSKYAMQLIEMTLCGHINPMLVRQLNHAGVRALGLTGCDSQILQCMQQSEAHGHVGRVQRVRCELIDLVMNAPIDAVPVIAPIGVDAQANALNVNADLAAAAIASALKVDQLVYLTDTEGIYDQKGHLISEIDSLTLKSLITTGAVKDGMLAKSKALLSVNMAHDGRIQIINGRSEKAVIQALLGHQSPGTVYHPLRTQEEVVK